MERKKILIADNTEQSAIGLLLKDDYTVIFAANGKEIDEELHKEEVSAVLLYDQLPETDVFDLIKSLKNSVYCEKIPVILYSDERCEERESVAFSLGAEDYIYGIQRKDVLICRIENAIGRKQARELLKKDEQPFAIVERLKPFFDVVRLVRPVETTVCNKDGGCDEHSCFSVWGKNTRCNNCISLKAYNEKSTFNKLEFSEDGLFFVVSRYLPYEQDGVVLETVTKMDDEYVENILDVQLLHTRMEEINRELETDALTEVYNKRHLELHLDCELKNSKQNGGNIGIAMADIDSFKNVNDTCGHLAGDFVLKSVAKILKENIASSKGDYVARFGGDEFLIVCMNIPRSVFERRLNEVAKLFDEIQIKGHPDYNVTVSFGCVSQDEMPCADKDKLIETADERLYLAKKKGKSSVVC